MSTADLIVSLRGIWALLLTLLGTAVGLVSGVIIGGLIWMLIKGRAS